MRHRLQQWLNLSSPTWLLFMIVKQLLGLMETYHSLRTMEHIAYAQWNWTMCSQYVNHSKFNSEHRWEGLCGDLNKESLWPLITRACQLWLWDLIWTLMRSAIAHRMRQSLIWFKGQYWFGVGSPHNRATYLWAKTCRQLLWSSVVCCESHIHAKSCQFGYMRRWQTSRNSGDLCSNRVGSLWANLLEKS